MKVPAVSLEVWRGLYESALRFMALRPWESLSDADVFGVRDPVTGQTGYCCIMGKLGQVLALCVYRGSGGLEIYRRMQDGDITSESDDVPAALDCLMGEFEDRSALKKEDLANIKALGLKFRGRKAYPVFRSYLPGYYPWFLTEEEAAFLTLAFDAAVQFVALSRTQSDTRAGHAQGSYPVYMPGDGIDSPRSWTTSWQTPDPLPYAPILSDPAPQELLREIQAKKLMPTAAWEVGSFIMPHATITDRDRPYYVQILLALHGQSGIILASEVVPAFEDVNIALRDFTLSAIRDAGVLPKEIRVCNPALAEAFNPIAALLGTTSSLRKKLPALTAAKRAMAQHDFPAM
jgi:hypothetical protein